MTQDQIKVFQDDELARLLKQKNRLAFNEIYKRFWKPLYNYTFNILNDQNLVEDVLQDVFFKIWVNSEKSEIQHLRAYLFNACRNSAISKMRQEKFTEIHERVLENLSLAPSVEQDLDTSDLKDTIDIAALSLPERCREIFYMSRFEHLSIQEIAEKLNISHRTVENQLSIALKHIRPIVSDSLYLILIFIAL